MKGSKRQQQVMSGRSPAQLQAAAQAEMRRRLLSSCFVPELLDSRPTAAQEAVLLGIRDHIIRFVVAGNQSGKTSLPAREMTWIIEGNHPYLDVEKEWGSGPLMFLVVGQDRTQIDMNLWSTRIKPFLNPAEWREVKSGAYITAAVHKTKGHQIIFLTHNNSSEEDIKHMQSYSAHWVWVDEMPKSIRVLEELQRRIDAKRGRFICTFTMKYRNDEIRRLVDASDGTTSRIYRLSKLDNPIYADRKEEELAKIAAYSPEMQAAILYGEWLRGDGHVYTWVPELMSGRPVGYNPSWRHVLSVDPATESKLGMTIWAEDPSLGTWWCVHASYVEGIYVPSLIVAEVEKRAAGLNITRRIYDSAEPWFAHQARHSHAISYWPVENKSGNKQLFIAKLQEALGRDVRIADWCVDLISEIQSCERSDTTDKIIGASRFHLLDSAHYFVVSRPPRDLTPTFATRADYLIQMDNKRIASEAAADKRKVDRLRKRRYTTNYKWTGR